MGSRAIESRFWAKVEKTDTCWLWTAYVRRDGYGTFGVSGQKLMAHRVSYECLTGSIPSGLQLDHLCRVRHCVNPAHLEPVTLQINISRGLAGAHQRIKTHCPQGHQYNEENTYHYADGSRHCRTCQRAYTQRARCHAGRKNLAERSTQVVTYDVDPAQLAEFDEAWKSRGYMARAEALRQLMRQFTAEGQAAMPLETAKRPA